MFNLSPKASTIQEFVTGDNHSRQYLVYQGGEFFSEHRSLHGVFLLRHAKGNFLIDTGLGRKISEQYKDFSLLLRSLFHYENHKPVIDQLNGLKIDGIFITHMHWDHTSGLPDFLGVPVYVSKEGLDFAKSDKASPKAFLKSSYDLPEIKYQPFEFKKEKYLNFEESLDFFGDGSLIAVPLPGHAPGGTGYIVDKKYFFVGDTIWSLKQLEKGTGKSLLASFIVDVDKDVLLESIKSLQKTKELLPEILILPSHDPTYFESQMGK